MKTRGYQFCCPGTPCHGLKGCEAKDPETARYYRAGPRVIVGRDFLTPELEEQLKRPGNLITISHDNLHFLPPRPSSIEPTADIWRPLSFRAKLRDWADWKPLCAFVEGLS